MMDAVGKAGDKIDDEASRKQRLGVPVVKISALKETGLKEAYAVKPYNESKKIRRGSTVLGGRLAQLNHLITEAFCISLGRQKVEIPSSTP